MLEVSNANPYCLSNYHISHLQPIPPTPKKQKTIKKEAYFSSFKQVFLKKSAVSCLIGAMFRQAGFAWVAVYSATFFREQFGLSLASVALLSLIGGILFALALIVGGHLVHKIGRKRQLVTTLVQSPAQP